VATADVIRLQFRRWLGRCCSVALAAMPSALLLRPILDSKQKPRSATASWRGTSSFVEGEALALRGECARDAVIGGRECLLSIKPELRPVGATGPTQPAPLNEQVGDV
jgi:hypothetical protein